MSHLVDVVSHWDPAVQLLLAVLLALAVVTFFAAMVAAAVKTVDELANEPATDQTPVALPGAVTTTL